MLQSRRRSIGRDARTVFITLNVSRNHLSAIENARALPNEILLRQLASILDWEDETDYLLDLLRIAHEDGWWDEYDHYANRELLDLSGLEYGAEKVRVYDPMLVTGLLQTEEYAHAIISAFPDVSQFAVDRLVKLRLKRQERLASPDPLQILALQGETALHQAVGGQAVLRRQLVHLASLVEELDSTLELRIQPFAATPVGFATAATTVLLDFTTPYLRTMSYTIGASSSEISHDVDTVELIELNFDLALEASLDRDASLDLIRRRIAALDGAA